MMMMMEIQEDERQQKRSISFDKDIKTIYIVYAKECKDCRVKKKKKDLS